MGHPSTIASGSAGEKAVTPLISVVIPTYNRWELLRQAIESVLRQAYPAIEVIVVDDGSTDETPARLEEYKDRVIVIHQENQGGTTARNRGLQAAAGQYVCILDHDDLWLPGKISRQVQMLEQNPNLGLVHCRWYFIDSNGRRLDKIGPLPAGKVLKDLLLGCFIWSGGPLIRRQCIEAVGLFDEAIWSSDWDMWLRIALAGYPFGCVQQPLGCYRITPGSAMSDILQTEQADVRIFEKAFCDERLPGEMAALKPQVLANWRFWLSRRYYAQGLWDDAIRNLSLAIGSYPHIFEDKQGFCDLLVNEALDVRVSEPVEFMQGVLGHLPPAAEALLLQREELLSKIQLGMALKSLASGDGLNARRQLSQSLALSPRLFTKGDYFAREVFGWAMRLSEAPFDFAAQLFENLPPEGEDLRRFRRRINSDLHVGCAFEEYYAGLYRPAVLHLVKGVIRRPAWLGNRGVLSIIAKSVVRIVMAGSSSSDLANDDPIRVSFPHQEITNETVLGFENQPLASVIIPLYNQAQFVTAAVESVLAQTWAHVEVIVVDDGSTDDVSSALASFKHKITCLHMDHGGLAQARNMGYRHCRGEYVLFLDADDRVPPIKLARHIQKLEIDSSLGLVYSAWQQVNEDGSRILGEVHPGYEGEVLRPLLRREFFFFASSAVLRRACLEEVGLFDETLLWSEDSDLWLRLARAGYHFGYVDEPLLTYRVHPGSMTSHLSALQVQGWIAGLDKFFNDPQLPDDILSMQAEAYSVMHFETAGRYFRMGEIEAAQDHFAKGLQLNPMVEINWLLEWVAGTALDPRTQDPEQFIALVFDNLPAQAASLRLLRGEALSRYHVAAAFSAYHSGNPTRARLHLFPAIRDDLTLLKNRGFLRLSGWAASGGRLFKIKRPG